MKHELPHERQEREEGPRGLHGHPRPPEPRGPEPRHPEPRHLEPSHAEIMDAIAELNKSVKRLEERMGRP